jgi:hypothetical protein
VQAGNASGVSSVSPDYTIVVSILVKPPAPTLSAITPNPSTTGYIALDWNDFNWASIYKVYRANTTITTVSSLTAIGTPTTSTYLDAGLSNGTYHHVVVVSNASGDSLPSNDQLDRGGVRLLYSV